MEQHPIPQQISSYEFKLVGEMTLKQFLKAAAGVVLAVIVNASGLVFFVKYPLMFAFGAGGLALAFVPFEDRPLETWLMAFLKCIYNPTIFVYKKEPKTNWLNIDYQKVKELEEEEAEELKIVPTKDKSKIDEFLASLSNKTLTPPTEEEENVELELEKIAKNLEQPKEEKLMEVKAAEEPKNETVETKDWQEIKNNLGLKNEAAQPTVKANFGSIPMPDIPEVPNLLVGMVTDSFGKIVEGAIVEVQDSTGTPVRVLKTNPLGQFRTSTQLSNGKYVILTEKEGYKFDKIGFDLGGKIVEPVRIQALA
jgi:hypothetical protein